MDITQHNYHIASAGTFVPVDSRPERRPDYSSKNRKGRVHNSYFYTSEGLYRVSDHWGRVAQCEWKLQGVVEEVDECTVGDGNLIGFISWKDLEVKN